jgi:DNA-binding beta-propeller fold protein YncE
MYFRTASVFTFAVASSLFASPSRAAAPTFQVLDGFRGSLAIVEPKRLLTASALIRHDEGFNSISIYTGLARDPVSGKVFVVAIDYRENFPKSYAGEVDFTTGVARTLGTITGEVVVDLAFDGTGRLYGLTDNRDGTTPHALLTIDKSTAAALVVKVLGSHNGPADNRQKGAIAWNPADRFLYYADQGNGLRASRSQRGAGSPPGNGSAR